MNILGISAFYHDSAAALVRDGVVVAAAQEERFSRIKNTSAFPIQSINFCVQHAGISFLDIDAIAYFEKPYLKFSRVICDHLSQFPLSLPSFFRSMPKWLDERLSLPLLIQNELNFQGPIYFVPHHLSHAACAFYTSPFREAAILTVDGVGERATMTTGFGSDHEIRIAHELLYPDSLGLLYTAATVYLGFHAHGGEGKTMGLAGFGEPRFLPLLREIVNIRPDGSFRIDQSYFRYRRGDKMWSKKLEKILGAPRLPGAPFTQEHYDIAASFQGLLEEILIKAARHLKSETKTDKLCLAGGVALNCVANKKMLDQTGYRDVFIPPAAGDAGGALGAALYVFHGLEGKPRMPPPRDAYLGPEFSEREILKALKASRLEYRQLAEEELCRETARCLHANQTVAWFQGRMEFGPRSLGNRSILANPTFAPMKDILNSRIKKREPFRPFAPVVLAERAAEYFELETSSPYMLLAPVVRPQARAQLPAITHVDNTARTQTVGHENPRLRRLLAEFEMLSGVPVLINTSLNRNGEPVACTPAQAIECFRQTELDCLVIGDFFLAKKSAN